MRIVERPKPPKLQRLKIVKPTAAEFYSVHTHSRFSATDALPSVKEIVTKAKSLGYTSLGLTDHGNIAGSVQLYTECAKAGIKPFPGSELYYVPDIEQYKLDRRNKDIKASMFHMCVLAYTTKGYENLVRLSTESHRRHHYKPLVDNQLLSQLADDGLLEGLAITTGCYFGYTVQSLIHRGEQAAVQFIATLESWFPGNVFVEVQNHHIEHDEEGWDDERVAQTLHDIADNMGLPLIPTQDSHYCDHEDRPSHEFLKRLVSWSDEPDDAVFPGDGFHMVDDAWMREHHGQARLARGFEGLRELESRHRLQIGVLDSYSYSVPEIVPNPAKELKARTWSLLNELYQGWSDTKRSEYEERLALELDIIGFAGMDAYMLLVALVTDHCKEQGWLYQTRGSAAGSLVCYLLGITQIDPIAWDLRFERFLSKDRTKPPDVDLDIQHDKRDELIAWMRTMFAVNSIGTWQRLAMNAEEDEDEGGSILKRFYQMQAKVGGPTDWADVPDETKQEMYLLDSKQAYNNMGKNAAGLVITSTREEYDRLIPGCYSTSSDNLNSQYPKDDIEAMGLVKLDVLGSKTLTVLARSMVALDTTMDEMLPIHTPKDLPTASTTKDMYRAIGKGDTSGVFQLEGGSTTRGCRELKPTTVHDLIAAMALFRPATMQSGATDSYIRRKHREEDVPDRHEIISSVTARTQGILLFQEQVIDVLRELGMEADDLTKFLKAVKASNKDIGDAQKVIDGFMPWIEERCQQVGFTQADWDWLQHSFDAFGGYSFNKAHASIYGLTAWRCAYLATYHPLEFFYALLSVASESKNAKEAKWKEQKYSSAARGKGIRISRPELNRSQASYSIDKTRRDPTIRKGLLSIHGIGGAAAPVLVKQRPHDGYRSVEDLFDLTPNKPITGGKEWMKAKPEEKSPELFSGVFKALWQNEAMNDLMPEGMVP